MDLVEEAHHLLEKALKELRESKTIDSMSQWRVAYISKKGAIKALYERLPSVPPERRAEVGAALNRLRDTLEKEFNETFQSAKSREREAKREKFDVTLPGRIRVVGRPHPIHQTLDEVSHIFAKLGFEIVTGPEAELRKYNFDMLNVPPDHPSIDDAYYVTSDLMLRSHTSPVQIRTMLQRKPPLRVIVPGRVYRPDTPDAGHLPMFHQVEGLMVGDDVTFAQLKGCLYLFARDMFGEATRVRFRASHFPFTEPSAEMDISCILCGGGGCPACKRSGWMEILGCGMVHPQVFRNVGYDAEKITGFAFGMGAERICMLRRRIPDIRYFIENHLEFLKQF